MQYALIQNGTVANIALGDEDWAAQQAGQWVAYTDENPACIGYGYDETTGVFEQPQPAPQPKPTNSEAV